MRRVDALAALVSELPADHLVVAGVGATSGGLWSLGPSPAHLYNMEFGYPSAVALGLALARPERTVVSVEGEGSAVAGVANWFTIARLRPPNLCVVVFDNGVYGTGPGTIPSPAGDGVRVDDLAAASGFDADAIARPTTPDEVRALGKEVASTPGLRFAHVRVGRDDVLSKGRAAVGVTFTEAAIAFDLHLRGVYSTESGQQNGGAR
ncbi:thiamine pyrophosphate-dependent enzyme [Jiangella mangrovi]|uniref:Thiamine pyrophosphate-dependent acetolactate synthase large subunit-like protein n=1 Tax=Jiangella mangrovi TaxID=1524084 RepID=A0A7W9GLL4_9ACTN|nr:thiamine pyrophosphate-dependent enzyme [Jiangella mangrovi]MBB5786137.1 thiamine pyrophosphate-dependent acetolactate synthase large subunit-like protein [Jiangella mangrovi]